MAWPEHWSSKTPWMALRPAFGSRSIVQYTPTRTRGSDKRVFSYVAQLSDKPVPPQAHFSTIFAAISEVWLRVLVPGRSDPNHPPNGQSENAGSRFVAGPSTHPARAVSGLLRRCENHPLFPPEFSFERALPRFYRWKRECKTIHARLGRCDHAIGAIAPDQSAPRSR